MTAVPCPAAEMLRLDGGGAFWARFDPDFYRAAYPDIARDAGEDDAALMQDYLEAGQVAGRSPNPWFDEAWYRRRHAEVEAAVGRGRSASGFDAFCRGGYERHSPHWLFDIGFYLAGNRDLVPDRLAQDDFFGPYDHYLKFGAREGRRAHPMFDPPMARAALGLGSDGAPYQAFLRAAPPAEPCVSPWFDPAWYARAYPAVPAGIARGAWRSALHHYLTNDAPTRFNPLPEFDEAFYLAHNPDIAAAVATGERRNGYAHFMQEGAAEGRRPSEALDLGYYLADNPDAREAVAARRVANGFIHYLIEGKRAGASPTRSAAMRLPAETEAKTLFRARARAMMPVLGRARLDFTVQGTPALSVVMVLHEQFELTLNALASLRANWGGAIQLILVDSGSTDGTRHLSRFVRGARTLRFDANIGYVPGCNAALPSIAAPHALLLNNDIELGAGAIAAALHRIGRDPMIGAVGARIIRPHGLLQEAGSIVWNDGTTEGYLRDAPADHPGATFTRDVDFCSAAFLMLRADLLARLEGFDPEYAPAYYEDADLCLRIAAEGYRIVYDPSVVVHHLEYGSGSTAAATDRMDRARAVFVRKHEAALAMRHGAGAHVLARARDAGRRRVLFIEDTLPVRMTGSGFVRANDIVRGLAGFGAHVCAFPVNGYGLDPALAYADLPDTTEILHDSTLADLGPHLDARDGYYDTVWVGRTHNLARVAEALLPWMARQAVRPRLILDTEAVASAREAERAKLDERVFDLDAALEAELAGVEACDAVVAVTEAEAELLRRRGLGPVTVLGHAREARPTPMPFAQRSGMLFVGGIHAMDSPNYDSLCWFIDRVLPIVEATLGWRTRLTVIGYTAPGVSLARFADHPRVTLQGAITDTGPAFDAHRVFVAPTRFAAGAPYKVHEAASLGLPVAATPLLGRQLGWEHERDLMLGDTPEDFAAAVLRLHEAEPTWHAVREAALARIRAETSPVVFARTLRDLVWTGGAAATIAA